MKATRYFMEQVCRKRPYVTDALCISVLEKPIRRVVQDDGRIRHWGEVFLPDEAAPRMLRVITLEDGETVHNAFIDRNFARQ